MSKLIDKFKKNSTLKGRMEIFEDSSHMDEGACYPTIVPALNVAMSGDINGGVVGGITLIAGPSKHFKSLFALLKAKAFQKAEPEGVILYFDCEKGISKKYMKSVGIDMSRVLHIPFFNLEELNHEIAGQLEEIDKKDKVFIMVDSLGNTASKKETADAKAQKTAEDMSRAKKMKSFFRIITPHIAFKNIPFVGIGHTYKTQDLFPKDVISGGQGGILASNDIWIVGRQQEKEGKDIVGWNYIINIEKSRSVKEKSKIPIQVTYDGGISKYTAILEWALESGHIHKPSNGWYQTIDSETGEIGEKKYRARELNGEVFKPILASESFQEFIRDKFQLKDGSIIDEDE